jgi:hypothetical protein
MRTATRYRGHLTTGTHQQLPEWVPPLHRPGTAPVAAACCCPALAQLQVVMPPTASRPRPTELLMCGHHYRVHRDRLLGAGAAVYDVEGRLLEHP